MAIPYMPLEILNNVLEFAPKDTLMKARLASKVFKEISARNLFGTITLRNTTRIVRNVRQILALQRLKRYVRTVHIIPRLNSRPSQLVAFLPWQTLVPELRYAFSDIHLSGNLSTFNLDLGGCSLTTCVGADTRMAEIDAFRSDLLCLFITTLMFSRFSLSRSPMRALSIQSLQSRSEHHVTYSPGFSNLLDHLKTLELSILIFEHECTRPNERPMSTPSWDFYTMLPEVWLTPANILTTLRLSADSHWGYYSKVDFRNVNFGYLQTLILDHFTFSHDWQRAWLLRHSMTLTHLVLSRCSILQDVWFKANLDGDGYPTGLQREVLPAEVTTYNYHTGWSDYLNTMSDSLTPLRSFSMINEDSKVVVANEVATVLHADRYLCFDFGYYIAVASHDTLEETEDLNSQLPYSMITEHRPQMRGRRLALAREYLEDERALRGLLDKVVQRNMRMGSRY